MPKRNSNGSTEPLPPEVTTNEPVSLDPHAKARRKTAVLWFVAVTFGTMALLSLPIGRLITSGFGKGGLIHDALGSVERLIRPDSMREPPSRFVLPPSSEAEPSGPVFQPEQFRPIELHSPGSGQVPVHPPRTPSITAVHPRPIRAGSGDKREGEGRGHHHHAKDGRHRRHNPHH